MAAIPTSARWARAFVGTNGSIEGGFGALGTSGISAFFATPVVAVALGAVIGAGALVLTRRASTMLTPETLEIGMARSLVVSSLGMLAAFLGLLAYFLWAREGLVYFGVAVIVGFLVPALTALFRFSGIAGTPGGGGR